MAASSTRSRLEPASRSTAKPIASPRTEMHKRPAAAKKAAQKSGGASKTAKRQGGKPKLVSSKLSFKGKVFNVYTDTLEEPGGHRHIKDVIRHNGSVVILAVDEASNPADPDVILERQYRHAAGQYLVEVPAGTRDPNEPPLAAAKRELMEETGYKAKRWTMMAKYYASPGFLGEWMQVFLARDLREGTAEPEQDENLEVFKLPLSEALRMLAAGDIHDGKTLIALSLYDRARRDGRL